MLVEKGKRKLTEKRTPFRNIERQGKRCYAILFYKDIHVSTESDSRDERRMLCLLYSEQMIKGMFAV